MTTVNKADAPLTLALQAYAARAGEIRPSAVQNGFEGVGLDPPWQPTTPLIATPLPAALPLFAGGLGALGLLGWRKKRKAVVLADLD